MLEILVGADPELFVCDGKTGDIVPAHLFTKGTKEQPEEIEPGFAVHYDNIALELNFPPSRTLKEWKTTIKKAVDTGEDVIGWDHDLVFKSAVRLPMATLESWGAPAMMFRCDPEMNIWGNNQYPHQEADVRAAAGHVHIGWGNNVKQNQREMVAQWCDAIIGVNLVQFEDDTAPLRRTMYGKPGSLRWKPYGLEYRTPSNQWMATIEGQETMFNLVHRCVKTAVKKGPFPFMDHLEIIKDVIMKSDKTQATELAKFFDRVI